MAKKKAAAKKTSRLGLLEAAKTAHQFDIGAGGCVINDPLMGNVRGIALPSLWIMELLGCTHLRDSCSILIDGEPGSSKSSLALEMLNWGRPYAATGMCIDAENKAAVDIAAGTLDDVHLWHPTHRIDFLTCGSIEDVQKQSAVNVARCAKANEGVERDYQIPFFNIIDPLSGLSSKEVIGHVDKQGGFTDRGHGGRDEALLWSKFLKIHNGAIINLPFISILVNHIKIRQEQRGIKQIERKVNPGGVGQNYAVTIGLRCSATAKQQLSTHIHGDMYQDIWISCEKNSRGPTGNRMVVRKYAKKLESGRTVFWWDWARASAEFLAGFGPKHEVNEVISVTKKSDKKYKCKQLGLDDVDPTEIGDAIHADEKLMRQIKELFSWKRVREFDRITDEEYQQLLAEARKVKEVEEARYARELENAPEE